MTLRLAILGLASFYGPAYASRATRHHDCTVVGCFAGDRTDASLASLDRPTRDEVRRDHEWVLYESADEVCNADIDAAIVSTCTHRRADDAIQLLDAGIPVLLAKPAAADAHDARRIAEVSTETGTPAMMTTPARFDQAIARLARRVRDGGVGDVLSVRASIRHDRVPTQGIDVNAEHAPDEAGAAYAMSVYTADAILWLMDSTPERVTAEYANTNSPHSTHPDLGAGTASFEDGGIASMTMTYTTDCREQLGNWEVEVVGTKGIVRTSHDGYEGIHWQARSSDGRRQEVFGRSQSPILDRQFDAFVDVAGGEPGHRQDFNTDVPAPSDMAAALELCEAWDRAADDAEVVYL